MGYKHTLRFSVQGQLSFFKAAAGNFKLAVMGNGLKNKKLSLKVVKMLHKTISPWDEIVKNKLWNSTNIYVFRNYTPHNPTLFKAVKVQKKKRFNIDESTFMF